MTQRITSTLESNPTFGWIGSIVSFMSGIAAWLMDHADDVTKIAGLITMILGAIAGYYTARIQRRTWQRIQKRK